MNARLIVSPRACARQSGIKVELPVKQKPPDRCADVAERIFDRANAGEMRGAENFFNSINFRNYLIVYFRIFQYHIDLMGIFDFILSINLFRNLSIFYRIFQKFEIRAAHSGFKVSHDLPPSGRVTSVHEIFPSPAAPASPTGALSIARRREKGSSQMRGNARTAPGRERERFQPGREEWRLPQGQTCFSDLRLGMLHDAASAPEKAQAVEHTGGPDRGGAVEKALQGEVMSRRAPPNAGWRFCASLLIVIPAKAGIRLRMWVNERRRFTPRRCAKTPMNGERRKNGFRLSPE